MTVFLRPCDHIPDGAHERLVSPFGGRGGAHAGGGPQSRLSGLPKGGGAADVGRLAMEGQSAGGLIKKKKIFFFN